MIAPSSSSGKRNERLPFFCYNPGMVCEDNDGASGAVPPKEAGEACDGLPREWARLCGDLRERLLGGSHAFPFQDWDLPQAEWCSRWTEAFRAIPVRSGARGSATILVPSESAASSAGAERAWGLRVAAADQMLRNPPGASYGLVAGVLGKADGETPGYIILDRSPHARRSLEERLLKGDFPTPEGAVCLGMALCSILESLNLSGVSLLELPLAAIVFEDSPGLRVTEILDPTAVVPESPLIPEWRALEDPTAPARESGKAVARAQVFLVAALVLAIARGTFRAPAGEAPEAGRSSTFARLAGMPELADQDAERIAAPLSEYLARKWPGQKSRVDCQRLVSVLRWALAESPDQRHPSLPALGAELESSLRK